jgi:hypothetical protein
MNLNAYREAMAQVEFDDGFESAALMRLSGALRKRRRRNTMLARGGIGLMAVSAAVAVAVFTARTAQAPPAASQIAAASPSVFAPPGSSAEEPAATTGAPAVVVSSEYGASADSYVSSPQPGQTLIAWELRRAIDDPVNADAHYFVQLDVFLPEASENAFSEYVYNGHSIAEWRVFVDLANGTYPYGEYNGDHGGDITEAQWQAMQEKAKTLDAQANLDAATAEYGAKVAPLLAESKSEREKSEQNRLRQLGFDVFFMDTWSYVSSAEKQYARILAGVLSADQLQSVADGSPCGYFVGWVHNGDGIVDWDEALRP